MRRKLAAYAQMMRLSNAPTVVTNVLVGAALAFNGTVRWFDITVFSAGMLCLYFVGMTLNDIVDQKYDEQHKPTRPLARGSVTRVEALVSCAALLVLSLFFVGGTAYPTWLALVICIVAYNYLHKRFAFSVFLMGMCRGLTYLHTYIVYDESSTRSFGAFIFYPPIATLFISTIAYIILLTVVARREDDGSAGWRAKLSVLMPFTIVAPAWTIGRDSGLSPVAYVSLAVFAVWMLRSCYLLLRKAPDIRGAVTGWLSGICLFDATLLSLNGESSLAFAAIACFAITAIAHRFVSGT